MDKEIAQKKFQLASELFSKGLVSQAFDILNELDNEFPNEREILVALARVYQGLGRFDEARRLAVRLGEEFGDVRGAKLIADLDAMAPAPVPPANGATASSVELDLDWDSSFRKAVPDKPASNKARKTMVVALWILGIALLLFPLVWSRMRPPTPASSASEGEEFSVGLILLIVTSVLLFAVPIILGIDKAIQMGRSPAIMLWAIVFPPLSGWITYLYLVQKDKEEDDAFYGRGSALPTPSFSAGFGTFTSAGCTSMIIAVLVGACAGAFTGGPNEFTVGLGVAAGAIVFESIRRRGR